MGSKRRLSLEQVFLGFLMQGPMHGYGLHERIEKDLSQIWYMGISNIYGTLKRLEQSGQVEFSLAPQEDRPPRKVYQITPAGKQSFLDWVRRPVPAMREMRVEFPTKLYFFRTLGLEGIKDPRHCIYTISKLLLADHCAKEEKGRDGSFY